MRWIEVAPPGGSTTAGTPCLPTRRTADPDGDAPQVRARTDCTAGKFAQLDLVRDHLDRRRGLFDESGHCCGLRDVNRVAARDLDDGRTRPRRHLALGRRRDHPVVGRDEIPTWFAAPRRFADRAAKSVNTPRHLRVGHERGLFGRDVGSERVMELVPVQEQEAVLRRQDASSYGRLWRTTLSVDLGGGEVALDLRHWVNSGLMTFFFFVVGLEARREFDLGELRERRRFALPLLAGIGGMAVAVAIYLSFNAGRSSAHGWGIVMSTDTAFALGLLALVGPRFPDRLRAFMLTVVVVDDLVALVVIATVYTETLRVVPLLTAVVLLGAVLVARSLGVRAGLVYAVLGTAAWVGLLKSGVEPVVIGLAMGLLVYAYPAPRSTLERATERFREFREQPTAELARSATAELRSATSFNERLQHLFHPWTSYVIVPLFALANAGIAVDGGFLARAFSSPITLGILVGYVVGKPVGILGGSWLVTRLSHGRLQPPVGWAAVAGGGTIAGIGFTIALLIATLAFDGR